MAKSPSTPALCKPSVRPPQPEKMSTQFMRKLYVRMYRDGTHHAHARPLARNGGKRNEASPNYGRRKPSSLSISNPRNVPFAWRRCNAHDGALFYTIPAGISIGKCRCGIAGQCRARRPRVAGCGLRHGVQAAFRAGAARGTTFSLPPLLRDFGEDEFVRKDARGGAFVRNREGGGVGGGAWWCTHRARTREESTTTPGRPNATFVQHFRA